MTTAGGKPGADRVQGSASVEPETQSASGRLFDLRELMAGLFLVFGVILVVAGIFDSQAEIDKASGVHINLWTGIGMVLLAGVFFVWRLWKPLVRENLTPESDDRSGPPEDPIAGH